MASASAAVDVVRTKEGSSQLIYELITAAKQGNATEVVRLVQDCKKQGIDIDTADTEGYTALYHAADDGSVETCKALLEAGADCYRHCGNFAWTPLHAAAFMNHHQVIHSFLERGKEPDSLDIENATPLYWAASRGRVHAVLVLLRFWADVNKRSGPYNGTALIRCCASLVDGVNESWKLFPRPESNLVEVIRLLVSAPSSNVNICNEAGETALYLACLAHSRDAVKLLLEADAHPRVAVGPILDSTIDGMIQVFAGIPRVVGVVDDDDENKSLSDNTAHSVVGTDFIVRSAAVFVQGRTRVLSVNQQVLSPDELGLNGENAQASRRETDATSVKTTSTPSSSCLLKVQIPAEATQDDKAALAGTLTAMPPIIELPTEGTRMKCPPVCHDLGGSMALASPYVSIRHSNQAAFVKQFPLTFVHNVALKEHHVDSEEKGVSIEVMQLVMKKDGHVGPWERVREDKVLVNEKTVEVEVPPNPNVAASIFVAIVKSDQSTLRKELQIWILGPRYLSPEMITEVACASSLFTTDHVMKALSERSQRSLQKWRGPDAIEVSPDSNITVRMSTRRESWAFHPDQQSLQGSLADSNIPSVTFCLESSRQQTDTEFICTCHIFAEPVVEKSISFTTPNSLSQSKEIFCSGSSLAFLKTHYHEAIAKSAQSVCFISTELGGAGTGTLVYQSGDLSVVLTAQHILEGLGLESAIFQFYCKDTVPLDQRPKFRLRPDKFYVFSSRDELDYALIAIEQYHPLKECTIYPQPIQKIRQNYVRPMKWCFLNQHPGGRSMETGSGKVVELVFKTKTTSPDFFKHSADTEPGSSGATVCDDRCVIIGVHRGPSDCQHWNQATHINAIIDDLKQKSHLQQDAQDIVARIVDMQ